MKLIIEIDKALYEWLHYQIGVEEPWNTVQMAIVDGEPPKEEKTGRWIIDGHHRKCQNCGEYFCITDAEGNKIPSDYCPNCGCRMSKVSE